MKPYTKMCSDIRQRYCKVTALPCALPHRAWAVSIRLGILLALVACGVFAPMDGARAQQPGTNAPQAPPNGLVPAPLVEKAAVFYGAQRWPGCRLISITPYFALDGSINAYAAQFAKDGSAPQIEAALARRVAAVEARQARTHVDRLPEEKRKAANASVLPGQAGTVIIAARYDLYPLLERFDGVAPHLKHASRAVKLAGIGKGRAATIERSFYLGPLSVRHEVRPQTSIAGEDLEPVLVDLLNDRALPVQQGLPAGAGVLPPARQSAGAFTSQRFWEEIDRTAQPPAIAAAQTRIIPGVPYYHQDDYGSKSCAPTACAQVLGYWDDHGYGNLVDGGSPTTGHAAELIYDLMQAEEYYPPLGTYYYKIEPGVEAVCNSRKYGNGLNFDVTEDFSVSWADDIKSEIDAGRPFLYFNWQSDSYPNWLHVSAVVGYDETSAHILYVHDNYPPDTPHELNWDNISLDNQAIFTVNPNGTPTFDCVWSEDFEGEFPGPWNVGGAGDAYWGTTSYRSLNVTTDPRPPGADVSLSAYCVANNTGAPGPYPDDTSGWMTYGPFSTVGKTSGEVRAYLWRQMPDEGPDGDSVALLASVDGVNFEGGTWTGGTASWERCSLDLADVDVLGNLMDRPQVWVAVWFSSNAVGSGEGAYVDNITIKLSGDGLVDDSFEENDSWAQAHDLGSTPATWLSEEGGPGIQYDDDWYRIAVPPDGHDRIVVDCRFVHGEGDINIELCDASGAPLVASTSKTNDEHVDYLAPAPGAYLIRVHNADAGSSYDLWWNAEEPETDDCYEENDLIPQAYDISDRPDVWLSAMNGPGLQYDDDWYEICVAPSALRLLVIECRFTHEEGDIDIAIHDAAGDRLAASTSATDNEFVSCVVPTAGAYYIRVYYGNTGSSYDLWWLDTPTGPPPPWVNGITPGAHGVMPDAGPKQTVMTIEGEDFGSPEGTVHFNGGLGEILSWSETMIRCRVPTGAASGGVWVRTAAGADSNAADFTVTSPATIHVSNSTNVPGVENGTPSHPFSTVQRGIDAASDGASVVVDEGTYVESIDLKGRAITVRGPDPASSSRVAATIIDGGGAGSAVTISAGEGRSSVLKGFSIRNGQASEGGGIYCKASSPTISDNVIAGNVASASGGGVYCADASPMMIHTTICSNSAGSGGGLYVAGGSAAVANSTITGNTAGSFGGGMACDGGSATISNSILWGNTAPEAPEIGAVSSSTLAIAYCNVAGGEQAAAAGADCALIWGPGNVDVDPLFADADNVDYHLRSEHGRWDHAINGGAGGWTNDDATSPCIDGGDPSADYSNEPVPNFGRANIGAYANTAEASKSGWNLPGDINDDCAVNVLDLLFVRNNLLAGVATGRNWKYDVNNDGGIDVLDVIFVRNRLGMKCN